MHLIIKLFNGEILERDIQKNVLKIGRSKHCDIIIAQEGISREHLLLEFSDGQFYVTDLRSKNGVFIDEEQIESGKRTLYLPSLQLTFGSVKNLEIHLDKVNNFNQTTLSLAQNDSLSQGNSDLTQAINIRREKKKREKPAPPSQKKLLQVGSPNRVKSLFMNFLAFLILAGTAYWYWQKENKQQLKQNKSEEFQVWE